MRKAFYKVFYPYSNVGRRCFYPRGIDPRVPSRAVARRMTCCTYAVCEMACGMLRSVTGPFTGKEIAHMRKYERD